MYGKKKTWPTIGAVLAKQLGCYMDNVFQGDAEVNRRKRKALRSGDKTEDECYDTGLRDIFLLSLLLNRKEMALRLWMLGADHMGSALMASNFVKSLSKEARRLDMMDIGTIYHEESVEWQNRAISMLSICYDQDQSRCFKLMTRSLNMWQGLTVLEMASFGRKLNFIDQPAVQVKLNMIWLGKMATFSKEWKIVLAIFCPFFIYGLRFEDSVADSSKVNRILNAEESLGSTNKALERDVEKASGCCPSKARTIFPMTNRRVGMDTEKLNKDDVILLRPGFWTDRKNKTISLRLALYYLYSSPIAKYVTHSVGFSHFSKPALTNSLFFQIFLAVFLFLYCFLVLTGPVKDEIGVIEIVVWIWAFIFTLEKLQVFAREKSLAFLEKITNFFTDFWIVSEGVGFILLLVALILRFVLPEQEFVYPRTIYAVSCLTYWIQALKFFYNFSSMGPRILMAVKMIPDITFLINVYVLVVLAFSVPIYSLLYPVAPVDNTWSFLHLVLDIFYGKIWLVFLTTLDETKIDTEGTCQAIRNGLPRNTSMMAQAASGDRTCPERNIVAILLYLAFLLVTNIILLKMLISFFAGTVCLLIFISELIFIFFILLRL